MGTKRIELAQGVELAPYTTIKIGGTAQYFFHAHSLDDVQAVLADTVGAYYCLGGGSNLLIRNGALRTSVVTLGQEFDYTRCAGDLLEAGAATKLAAVLKYCVKHNLGGLHELAGIPATIGGLVRMNASSFGREICSVLVAVEAVTRTGTCVRISRDEMVFGYRSSSFGNLIITRAWFRVTPHQALRAEIANILSRRYQSQDFTYPSCGSVFKNPTGYAAGFLIDSCGLKGLTVGDAQVSSKHANFIINTGRATYADVDCIIGRIKDTVHRKFGVILEEEIERWM
ncbi:MAG: UDP-N-acetylmuramate dehydrogenase [Candidatus Omnitrophota bacterium]|nr:UDP-N-acetylmuramate dehydrogenase [Candidatus Omnitrophota bacterium]